MDRSIEISTITPCFRMEKYLDTFLSEIPNQSLFPNFEVILDLNEPTATELEIVLKHKEILGGVLRLNIVDKVDPIGTSMNRCIELAKSPYLAIWNVDDLRTPFSLEEQVNKLKENPECGFVYGPYRVVKNFKSQQGSLVDVRNENQSEFGRKMLGGPFMAFSKHAIQSVGLFDEQLKSAADFDLAVRLAHFGPLLSTNRLLGYYLNEGLGSSTRVESLGPRERTVIQLRYGIFAKLDSSLIPLTVTYNIPNIKFGGEWHPITKYVFNYSSLIEREKPLMPKFKTSFYNFVSRALSIAKFRFTKFFNNY